MVLATIPAAAVIPDLTPDSETEKTRLTRDEITILMIAVERIPVLDQEKRMDQIWADKSGGSTPRSDFLFATAYAYLGNCRAQAYLGYAYENGRGIVVDLEEAYVWYSIALEGPIENEAEAQQTRPARERIKIQLQSNYPGPSDEELEKMVKDQEERISRYLAEIHNTKL